MSTKKGFQKKLTKIDEFQVFTDCEWRSDNVPVSVQVSLSHSNGFEGRYIVINSFYEEKLDESILNQWKEEKNCEIVFYNLSDDTNVIHALIEQFYFQEYPLPDNSDYYFSGDVFMFYSFQDLGFSFGWNNVLHQLKNEVNSKKKTKIEQFRSITGTLKITDANTTRQNKWRIRDLSGLTNMGLKDFAESLGISMENKELLDDLKSTMDIALVERTKIFLEYALDDVLVLRSLFQNFLHLVNDILLKTLFLPEKFLFTETNLPLTTGSLVAATFEKYIYYSAQKLSQGLYYDFLNKNPEVVLPERKLGPNSPFYLALWSLGFLKKTHGKRDDYLAVYKDLYTSGEIESILEKSLHHGETLSKWAYSSPFDSLPYSGASIETLAQGDTRTTSLLNCLVSGGRAYNELPSQYKVNHVLDVDLQSCYGTALASFEYPIGLPTIVAFGPNETKLTLREFLKQYEHELIPGLYKITVSGKLSFNQDVLFSKVTSVEKMKETIGNLSRKFESGMDDVVHFANDFVLARKECLNATITHDLLDVLRKVSTNNELREILNLEVETALFWKKSDRCDSCKSWVVNVLKNPGELVFDTTDQGVNDTRSRLWYSLSFKDFIGKLVERRNLIKKRSKETTNHLEKARLLGLQNLLKLFINTLYGCLASPYFSIGNVVLADCITARARMNVWLLCKGLNLRQSITDGGLYSPCGVNLFKEGSTRRKPGLNIMCDVRNLQNHRSIYVGPLKNIDWPSVYADGSIFAISKNIDRIVYEHINNFLNKYDLCLTNQIEHKVENTALVGIFTSKANYALLVFNTDTNIFNKKYFRLRGARLVPFFF